MGSTPGAPDTGAHACTRHGRQSMCQHDNAVCSAKASLCTDAFAACLPAASVQACVQEALGCGERSHLGACSCDLCTVHPSGAIGLEWKVQGGAVRPNGLRTGAACSVVAVSICAGVCMPALMHDTVTTAAAVRGCEDVHVHARRFSRLLGSRQSRPCVHALRLLSPASPRPSPSCLLADTGLPIWTRHDPDPQLSRSKAFDHEGRCASCIAVTYCAQFSDVAAGVAEACLSRLARNDRSAHASRGTSTQYRYASHVRMAV